MGELLFSDVVGIVDIGDDIWVVVTGCLIARLRSSIKERMVLRTLATGLAAGEPAVVRATGTTFRGRLSVGEGWTTLAEVPPAEGEDVTTPTGFRIEETRDAIGAELFGEAGLEADVLTGTVFCRRTAAGWGWGGSSLRSATEGTASLRATAGGDAAFLLMTALRAMKIPDDVLGSDAGTAPAIVEIGVRPIAEALARLLSMDTTTSSGNRQRLSVGTQSTSARRVCSGSRAFVNLVRRVDDHCADKAPITSCSLEPSLCGLIGAGVIRGLSSSSPRCEGDTKFEPSLFSSSITTAI